VRELLLSIADELDANSHALVETAHQETHLPALKLENELTRTTGQLHTFAEVAAAAEYQDRRVELISRSLLVPLGPVAVFGASNFPFAFSTCGGGTVSALAARCPVVFKAHPGHPKTSEMAFQALQRAIATHCLHPSLVQMVEGDPVVGHSLVAHPGIKAVSFTGSQRAGKALLATGHQRNEPIPFYCEMASVNPVFIFPGALKDRASEIAEGLCHSVVLGGGQTCTNPGLVFVIGGAEAVAEFISLFSTQMSQVPCHPMLTPSIFDAYNAGVAEMKGYPFIRLEYKCASGDFATGAGPAVFSVSYNNFINNNKILQKELFGPSTLLVRCSSVAQLSSLSQVLEGQLSASFHGSEEDQASPEVKDLLSSMSLRVGRMVWGGYPTGIAVNASMQHGGPWPASSDCRFTSVGTRAILRWLRPVCYQDFPNDLLPQELRD